MDCGVTSTISSSAIKCIAVGYGLFHLEPRGQLFVVPGDAVYEGMVIGEYNKDNDLNVNPCKEKKLSHSAFSHRKFFSNNTKIWLFTVNIYIFNRL